MGQSVDWLGFKTSHSLAFENCKKIVQYHIEIILYIKKYRKYHVYYVKVSLK